VSSEKPGRGSGDARQLCCLFKHAFLLYKKAQDDPANSALPVHNKHILLDMFGAFAFRHKC
jgi:hypothetical protein